MDGIYTLFYDADFLTCACKLVSFIFSLEAFSYVVGLLANIRNTSVR